MKKMILLLFVLVGAALALSGCGHWGCWNGDGHSHGQGQSHSHYAGCGHSGY
jgi:hypothetical protein